jgi:hypothetical protein
VAESVSGREKANGNRRIHRGVVKWTHALSSSQLITRVERSTY